MKRSIGEKLFSVLNYTLLILLCISIIFPFWRILMLSLNDGIDAMKGGIYFWPREPTWNNYLVIFARTEILDAYKVTILRTLIGTVMSVFLMAALAYGLSKKRLKGRTFINAMILFTMFFNGGLIPLYLLLKDLHLLNTLWVYIIPALYQVWYIILFRTFFMQMPEALEESAKIDGASDLTVFFRIVVPLSLPVIATITLFTAVGHWNDWFAGTVYVQNPKLIPLQTLLMRIINENDSAQMIAGSLSTVSQQSVKSVTTQSVKMSTLVVTILPIVCLYPFLQKYFVKGVMVGSIKG